MLKNTTAQILSVDTSIDWIKTIKQSKVYDEQKIKLKYIDVGKVENWGFPIDYSKRDSFIDYTNWVWKQNLIPDTVLIDGRFRVCCFFTCLKFAKEWTIIIFDDYFTRPYYHIVEKYLRVHQKCGRQAIFKISNKEKFDLKNIDIEINQRRDYITVNLSDTGEGFKDKKTKDIIRPYYTTKEKGTGLGLSIVDKIINDHNGSIKFLNTNNGAKVQIIIPK